MSEVWLTCDPAQLSDPSIVEKIINTVHASKKT